MRGLLSRAQPSALSRSLSSTRAAQPDSIQSDRGRGRRGLVAVASGLFTDGGTLLGDVAQGDFTKIPADLSRAVTHAVENATKHVLITHTGDKGTPTLQHPPTTTAPPAAGGGQAGGDSQHTGGSHSTASPYDPGSSASSVSGPAQSGAAQEPGAGGAINFATGPSPHWDPSDSDHGASYPTAASLPNVSENGGWSPPPPTDVTMHTTATSAVSHPGGRHGKGFPLAAAAAIGGVLGFLVVSALFWGVWLYLRKRRRALRSFGSVNPQRMLSVTSGRTVSTVPLFISASEAGVRDESPFKHPRDVDEDDPFDAASLWSASTKRSASTLSV